MKDETREQLEAMFIQAKTGFFGPEAQEQAKYFESIGPGMPIFYEYVHNFYQPRDGDDALMFQTLDIIAQCLMVVYRETKEKNPEFAEAFLRSFFDDFPGTDGTALLSKWQGLTSASMSFKAALARNADPNSLWQPALQMTEAYHEFLGGLLGYLIIGWQVVLGKTYSLNTFDNAYGNKVDVFSQLTDGNDGAFYLFHRIANHHLRNAIAHKDIHLKSDKGEIIYYNGKGNKRQMYTVSLVDFLGFAALGSHLAQTYLTGLSCIAIYEYDTSNAMNKLPEHVYRLLDSPPRII